MDLSLLARILALFGLILLLVAGLLLVLDRLNLPLGDLPGDIRIQSRNFTCAFPIVTSLVISIVVTILLNLVLYVLKK